MKNRKLILFSKHDVLLIIIICVLATILNVFSEPFLAATIVVGGILLMRLIEYRENATKNDVKNKQDERDETPITNNVERRTAQEIIESKLNDGVIEKAIDKQFDTMIENIVNDLFGKYGDVSRTIESKLKENMNSYIGTQDFSQYNTKLEHLLNQLVESLTKDQRDIINNTKQLMGLPKVTEIKATELFNKYAEHIASIIDTDKLEVNTDDIPSYENLTCRMMCDDVNHMSSLRDKKQLVFTCEQDNNLSIAVTIHRWVRTNSPWTIEHIKRISNDEPIAYAKQRHDTCEITSLETPFSNLRDLNDLEIYLLKLYYDQTAIILDELDIEDENIEVDAEPEARY